MGKFKFIFSVLFAKTSHKFLEVTKLTSGTSIIGKFVLKFNPDFLNECNSHVGTKINITGTNGKTTTSGIVNHILTMNAKSVINNSEGANMITGIANTLAVALPFKKNVEYSVLETDEAYLSKVYDNYDADYLLVTNLFQDQLDRYGNPLVTKNLIQDAIKKKPNLKLILNADDPLVASFEGDNKIYYGIDNVYYADESLKPKVLSENSYVCHCCGEILDYEKVFYAHQGHYSCKCGFRRPNLKYNADVTVYKDCSVIQIDNESFKVPIIGLFNAYNALGAICLCKELGIKYIDEYLGSFKVAFGRSDVRYFNGKRNLVQLIKNPAGANEVLKTIDKDSNILIAITDKYADGRDISWLWDVEFERLVNSKNEIVVSGIRAKDMALRLKYAEVKNVKIIEDIASALNYVEQKAEENITILSTYSALLEVNKIIKE